MTNRTSVDSGKEYRDVVFEGNFEDVWEKNVFENCRFEKCTFDGAEWARCHFYQCVFQDCRVLNVQPGGSKFQGVSFVRCKVAGFNFGRLETALLFDVTIRDCKILSCTFPRLDLTKSKFSSNEMDDCLFDDSDLRGLDFSGTSFGETHFRHCNLEKANFTEATNFIINPLENKIKGAIFSVGSALELLNVFGIVLN